MMTSTETVWITPQAQRRLRTELDKLRRLRDGAASPEVDNWMSLAALNGRIRRICEILAHAVVGDAPPDDGVAEPGMVLTVRYDDAGATETFLLAAIDADGGDLEVCSPHSPLGSAILGTRPGQQCTYRVPSGDAVRVTLLNAVPYGSHEPLVREPRG